MPLDLATARKFKVHWAGAITDCASLLQRTGCLRPVWNSRTGLEPRSIAVGDPNTPHMVGAGAADRRVVSTHGEVPQPAGIAVGAIA